MSTPTRTERQLSRVSGWMETAVGWAEGGVAVILTVVIAAAIFTLLLTVFNGLLTLPYDTERLGKVIKAVLDVFIVIELFRITIAYVRHGDIVSTVLETALVVAAREVVVVEAGKDNPIAGAAVALTLIAIGVTWWLLRKADAVGPHVFEGVRTRKKFESEPSEESE